MRIEASAESLEQSRRLNDAIEQVLAGLPSVHTVDLAETRRQQAEGGGIFTAPRRLDEAEERIVAAPTGPVPVRVLAPPVVDAVYLHLHGGGWTIGGPDHQDERLWAFAQATDMAVVSVDYRLAPEHPFPAGPDDCEAVARWLLDGAAAELGSERLMIGRESAGAHLAVLTLLRLRDAGAPIGRFVGTNLIAGAYDLSGTPSQRRWGDRNLILSGPIIEWFYECALPGLDPEARRDPAISPLYADLSGLPPALIVVGEHDPLLDDSLFLAARWEQAGARADLAVYPESIHAFTGFPTDLAGHAAELQRAFVRRVLSEGSAP